MGQQESSYRKFDDKVRRRKPESATHKAEDVEETGGKVRAGPPFSLKSLKWRPSLVTGSGLNNNLTDLASCPGWYHGWCNRSQVTTNKQTNKQQTTNILTLFLFLKNKV